MLQEFIHDHKVYAIKKEIDIDASNEEVVLFRDLNSAQAFFRSIAKDPFACEDVLSVAKWIGISNPGSPKKQDRQSVQQILEQLCLKIYAGNLILVEIKPMPVIWLEECCIESIAVIKGKLKSSPVLDKALLVGKLATIFSSNSRGSSLASIASSAIATHGIDIRDINSKEWEALARSIIDVPKITRKSIFKVAKQETFKHLKENKQELRLFWEGVMDVFA